MIKITESSDNKYCYLIDTHMNAKVIDYNYNPDLRACDDYKVRIRDESHDEIKDLLWNSLEEKLSIALVNKLNNNINDLRELYPGIEISYEGHDSDITINSYYDDQLLTDDSSIGIFITTSLPVNEDDLLNFVSKYFKDVTVEGETETVEFWGEMVRPATWYDEAEYSYDSGNIEIELSIRDIIKVIKEEDLYS